MGTLKKIFDKDGIDGVKIELVKEVSCNNKRELCKAERVEFDKYF